METTSIINDGLTLLALGMGFVYVFLTVLVIATTVMSKLIMKYSAPEPLSTPNSSPQNSQTTHIDPNVLTAIKEAIKLHRQQI